MPWVLLGPGGPPLLGVFLGRARVLLCPGLCHSPALGPLDTAPAEPAPQDGGTPVPRCGLLGALAQALPAVAVLLARSQGSCQGEDGILPPSDKGSGGQACLGAGGPARAREGCPSLLLQAGLGGAQPSRGTAEGAPRASGRLQLPGCPLPLAGQGHPGQPSPLPPGGVAYRLHREQTMCVCDADHRYREALRKK